jgi:hypothetical protein
MIERNVKLNEIDLDSEEFDRYLISFKPDVSLMVRSLREVGVMSPVILVREEELRIVSGLKRALASREIGTETVPAHIYEKDEKTHQELLRIAIYENLGTRRLCRLEKAVALHKLHRACGIDVKALIEEFADAFEIPPTPEKFLEYIGVAELEDPVREALARGDLEFQACVQLSKLKRSECNALFGKVLSAVTMNLNESVQFIDDMRDLALILHKEIGELCKRQDIERILEDATLNRRGKGSAVRELVRKLRFPELTRHEEAFKKEVAALSLGAGIRIQHPPFFEGDYVSIQVKSESADRLLSQLGDLTRTIDTQTADRLLRIIQAR